MNREAKAASNSSYTKVQAIFFLSSDCHKLFFTVSWGACVGSGLVQDSFLVGWCGARWPVRFWPAALHTTQGRDGGMADRSWTWISRLPFQFGGAVLPCGDSHHQCLHGFKRTLWAYFRIPRSITSRQIDGEKRETVADFIFLGSKITVDDDCSHEIKRRLLLGRKAMTNLDSVLKNRDITLPTKVCLVKAMAFPVVMYRCETWTIKKSECWRIDAFELWCWRILLGVPWTVGRSSQSILKEISREYSLGGLLMNLKLWYFGRLIQRAD